MSESDAPVYEMLWDCKFCGQRKLLGLTHRFCANCGAPQDPAKRYYPADDEKVAVKDHPFAGADVTCPACGHAMGRAAKCCTHCGGPIAAGKEVGRREDVVVPDTPAPAAAPAPQAKRSPWFGVMVGGAVVLVLGIVGVVLAMVLWKRTGLYEVTGHTWERTIAIERFGAVKKRAWCDELPASARVMSRSREARGSTKVPDGESCQTRKKDMGNGTFKEIRECTPKFKDQPVLADRCEFEAEEWQAARTLSEKGTSPKDPPRWPAVTLARTGACVGCERPGARSETYELVLRDTRSGSATTCKLPEARWATFAKGSRWQGTARVMTGGVDCDGLKAP